MNREYNQYILIALISLISIASGFSQGELVNRGESANAYLFSTAKPDGFRIYTLGYTYVHERKSELGIYGFTSPRTRQSSERQNGFLLYGAKYLNTGTIVNLKGTVGGTYVGSDLTGFIAATVFGNRSKTDSKIVPFATLQYGVDGFNYSGVLDFKLGTKNNLIGGIGFTKIKRQDWIISFGFGLMFMK